MENNIKITNGAFYKKVNDFYESSVSMIFFLSIMSVFSLIQMVLFFTGIIPVNHTYFGGGSVDGYTPQKASLLYFSFFMSITGAIAGFVGGVLGVRMNPQFIWWATWQSTCTAITAIIMGSIIYGIFTALIIITNFVRKYVWSSLEDKDISLNNKENIFIIGIIGAVMMIVLMIIVSQFQISMYGFPLISHYPWYGYFDVLGSVLNLMGIGLLLIKSRVAFPVFLLAKLFLFFEFGVNGQIVPIIQMSLFAIMDVTAFLSWSHISNK